MRSFVQWPLSENALLLHLVLPGSHIGFRLAPVQSFVWVHIIGITDESPTAPRAGMTASGGPMKHAGNFEWTGGGSATRFRLAPEAVPQ